MQSVLHLILVGPLLAAGIVILLARYFMHASSDPLRARLTVRKARPLALLTAFSPVLSFLPMLSMRGLLPPQASTFLLVSLVVSAFGATALAACWLALSPDSRKPLPPGRTTALGFVLLFANLFLLPLSVFFFEKLRQLVGK